MVYVEVKAAVLRQEKARAEELALIQLEPDPAWFKELSGEWTAPGLGKIELRTEKGKAVLDPASGRYRSARRSSARAPSCSPRPLAK